MEAFLTVIHWFVAIALIVLVLIQAGSSDMGTALGGGGGSSSLMGAGGGESFKRKLTAGFAIVFFIVSFSLSYFFRGTGGSVIGEDGPAPAVEAQKAPEVPAAPEGSAPAQPGEGGTAPAAAEGAQAQ